MAKSKVLKELANGEITLEVALNRLLIIASDLNNEELSNWAEYELRGYESKESLPPYRRIRSLQFTYSGISGNFQVTNCPFPHLGILAEIKPDIFNIYMTDSIMSLESALNSKDSQLYLDYTRFASCIYEKTEIQCSNLRQCISNNTLENIISEIKTRLIKIFLKLDKEYGCLDDLDIDVSQKNCEEVRQINQVVNNYIYADNSIHIGDKNHIDGTNLASGGE